MGFIIAFLGTGAGIGVILMLLAYGLDGFFSSSSQDSVSTPHQTAQAPRSVPPPKAEDRLGD